MNPWYRRVDWTTAGLLMAAFVLAVLVYVGVAEVASWVLSDGC